MHSIKFLVALPGLTVAVYWQFSQFSHFYLFYLIFNAGQFESLKYRILFSLVFYNAFFTHTHIQNSILCHFLFSLFCCLLLISIYFLSYSVWVLYNNNTKRISLQLRVRVYASLMRYTNRRLPLPLYKLLNNKKIMSYTQL